MPEKVAQRLMCGDTIGYSSGVAMETTIVAGETDITSSRIMGVDKSHRDVRIVHECQIK